MGKTVSVALREQCMECLDATPVHGALDCLGESCTLYPCHPFRGRDVPQSRRGAQGMPDREGECAERLAREIPKRRASRALVAEICADCFGIPGETCAYTPCPLYALSPQASGKRPLQEINLQRRSTQSRLQFGDPLLGCRQLTVARARPLPGARPPALVILAPPTYHRIAQPVLPADLGDPLPSGHPFLDRPTLELRVVLALGHRSGFLLEALARPPSR